MIIARVERDRMDDWKKRFKTSMGAVVKKATKAEKLGLSEGSDERAMRRASNCSTSIELNGLLERKRSPRVVR
jgi:hypothetical protein